MTDATTPIQETPEVITPQAIPSYHWSDFLTDGEARHLYTAGLHNKGFEPGMITPSGVVRQAINKKYPDQPFDVRYDKDFILEILSRQMAALGIIDGATIDQAGMSWLLNELVAYAPKYAERNGKIILDSTEKKAKELAKMFPGKSFDEWLNDLKVASQPKGESVPEPEPSSEPVGVDVEVEKSPSTPKDKKAKTATT